MKKTGTNNTETKKARQNKRTIDTILVVITAVSVLIGVLVAESINLGYTAKERRNLYEQIYNK